MRQSLLPLPLLVILGCGSAASGGPPGGLTSSAGGAPSGGAASPATGGQGSVDPAGGTGGALPSASGGSSGGSPAAGGADGTGSTSETAGGSGGAVVALPGFDPCPALPAPCAILTLGDSITDGYSATHGGGYRVPLFQLALENNKSITFVGSRGGGPSQVLGVAFPDAHEGHSGASIDDLIAPIQDAVALHPNIILVMAGTNGCEREDITIVACMGTLLNATLAAHPNALVVVAKTIPTNPDYLGPLNAGIPALAAELAQAGKHIIVADLYEAFLQDPNYGSAYLVDYAHPNDPGYALMAEVWYQAIARYLH
jgi:lysophospholipase L1-like esterase